MPETLWEPGVNCDVILAHPKHGSVPLVGYRIPSDPIGPRVKIHYETYWGDMKVSRENEPARVRYLWFTALIDDELLDPQGGRFPLSAAELREKLNAILYEKTDILLYTRAGIISGLYSTDHAIIDTIYQNAHTVEIYLTTRSLKDIPLGPEGKNVWLPKGILPPYSVWNGAVWR